MSPSGTTLPFGPNRANSQGVCYTRSKDTPGRTPAWV